jgi:hypothetical protein
VKTLFAHSIACAVVAAGAVACVAGGDAPEAATASLAADRTPRLQMPPITLKPLPPEYAGLLTHSIFADPRLKKGRSETGAAGTGGDARPESALVLRGVYLQDRRFTALIEDAAASRVRTAVVGTRVGAGRVRSLSLQGADFELNGVVTAVAVGQRFDGTAAAGDADRPTRKPRGGDSPAPNEAAARKKAGGDGASAEVGEKPVKMKQPQPM